MSIKLESLFHFGGVHTNHVDSSNVTRHGLTSRQSWGLLPTKRGYNLLVTAVMSLTANIPKRWNCVKEKLQTTWLSVTEKICNYAAAPVQKAHKAEHS